MKMTFDEANATFNISGELNLNTLRNDGWPELVKEQKLAGSSSVRLNVENVEHIDSSGLAWLINLKRDAERSGTLLSISPISGSLRRLAELSGVISLLSQEVSDDE